jgi:hypothetical protein
MYTVHAPPVPGATGQSVGGVPTAAAVDAAVASAASAAALSSHRLAFAPYRRRIRRPSAVTTPPTHASLDGLHTSHADASGAASRSDAKSTEQPHAVQQVAAASAAPADDVATVDEDEDANRILTEEHVQFLFDHHIRSRQSARHSEFASSGRAVWSIAMLTPRLACSCALLAVAVLCYQPRTSSALLLVDGRCTVPSLARCSPRCNRASACRASVRPC